jgi:hypothetical protein
MRWWMCLLATAVAACAVAASNQSTAPPSIPPTGMCRPVPAAELPPASQLEPHGWVGERQIWATPGELACSEAALGAVDCFARAGGRALIRIEGGRETVGFDLQNQEALRIAQDHVMCVPPTDGPMPVETEPQLDMNEVHAAISSEAYRLYREECGEVRVPERAIEAIEITGGGNAEYAVLFSRVQCATDGGPTTRWQGTGGAVVQFWLASGGPPRLLLEHSMLGFSPTGDGLITHQHGAFCPGGAGPNVCEVIYRWNDRDRSLEVNSRIALEESAEIDRQARALRFSYDDVSRW